MTIISAQHSEVRLFPTYIEFRSHNDEWVRIDNIKAVYFTQTPSDRFSFSNNPTDIAIVVQNTDHSETLINIQNMRLNCYLVALHKHLNSMYTLLTKQSETKMTEDKTNQAIEPNAKLTNDTSSQSIDKN